jgi:large subunit ribosomal protein L29
VTKIADLRSLGLDELRQRERDLADQIFRLRIQKSLGQVDVPSKLKSTRRDLARIKTLLAEHGEKG